ncbi:MAG: ABC transporter ATP-binding protein [Terriglobales bacterium]
MSVLALEQLVAGYGPIRVVRDVSLAVGEGEVVALLGRNGAGKTTMLKGALGMVRVFSGRVLYRGRDVTRLATHRRAMLGMGYVPDDRRIFPELTVRENLEVAIKRGSKNGRGWTLERIYQLMPWLKEIQRRRGGFLSGGEQQMLTIARTMMGNPEVLLLDEPTEGLAPHFVRLVSDLIKELKSSGIAVLLAEQNLRFITPLANRVYVIESGELRLEGTMAAMAERQDVRALLAL